MRPLEREWVRQSQYEQFKEGAAKPAWATLKEGCGGAIMSEVQRGGSGEADMSNTQGSVRRSRRHE